MSQEDQQIGVFNGSDGEWYWQIFALEVIYKKGLSQATTGALSEAKSREDIGRSIRGRLCARRRPRFDRSTSLRNGEEGQPVAPGSSVFMDLRA